MPTLPSEERRAAADQPPRHSWRRQPRHPRVDRGGSQDGHHPVTVLQDLRTHAECQGLEVLRRAYCPSFLNDISPSLTSTDKIRWHGPCGSENSRTACASVSDKPGISSNSRSTRRTSAFRAVQFRRSDRGFSLGIAVGDGTHAGSNSSVFTLGGSATLTVVVRSAILMPYDAFTSDAWSSRSAWSQSSTSRPGSLPRASYRS